MWLIDNGLTDKSVAAILNHFNCSWQDIAPSNDVLLFGDYLEGMGAEQRFYDEVKGIGPPENPKTPKPQNPKRNMPIFNAEYNHLFKQFGSLRGTNSISRFNLLLYFEKN